MNEIVNEEENSDSLEGIGLYPIRTVSRLTGVPPVTLRAWERRYRLITPTRTEKGHRLYTMADIQRVRQILALLDQGVGVGQVGSLLARAANDSHPGWAKVAASTPVLLTPDPADVPAAAPPQTGVELQPGVKVNPPAPVQGTDPWPAYIVAMIQGVERFDAMALDAVYNDALSLYSIELVSSRLTTPVLDRLGAAWPQGEASIAREHFFSNFLRNKLGARFQYLNAFGQGPRLVAACPAGEYHELGLIQFALAAAGQGYRLVMLGADVPATEIATAARIAACQAVVLSVSARISPTTLAGQLAELSALTSLPILVGGAASLRSPQIIVAAGARPLGTDFTPALRLIGEWLGWP